MPSSAALTANRWRNRQELRGQREHDFAAVEGVLIMHPLAIIFRVMHASRTTLRETGRDPTPEELAEKLDLPLETVRKVMKIARESILLENPYA
jgi:DNA-directed RNA polymerase sigma subunit (sigma70/sigma32)